MQTCEQHYKTIIVYDSINCPICKLQEELDDKISENEILENKIGNLEITIEEIKDELKQYE
jgi:predicted nuclease with TOPRIM domain